MCIYSVHNPGFINDLVAGRCWDLEARGRALYGQGLCLFVPYMCELTVLTVYIVFITHG